MKVFIDSAKINEIRQAKEWGMLDGVTTNPSLLKKAVDDLVKKGKKLDIESYLKQILKAVGKKPVSLEVVGSDYDEMIKEGLKIYKIFNGVSKNVYVKIPVNPCLDGSCSKATDGIRAIKYLSDRKIPVNCTLIFTPEQALLAAKAGAKFVSPFVGREDDYIREMNRIQFGKEEYYPAKGVKKLKKIMNDNGIVSGVDLIKEIRELFDIQKVKGCEILAASIRNTRQFREVAIAGADIATLPFSVMGNLLSHPKSEEGMRKFTQDIVPEYAKLVGLKVGKK
ncbi:transaldolase [Candidatus Pacearchaeota archaeon CG10_big_fil_rev_8_21_14_0_10_31_24]|nr:MAG: transaldolase [Candidatus Pacearchaeota archaeon CG10_big_fil_rev_8_21_14_0_10_31_24]